MSLNSGDMNYLVVQRWTTLKQYLTHYNEEVNGADEQSLPDGHLQEDPLRLVDGFVQLLVDPGDGKKSRIFHHF